MSNKKINKYLFIKKNIFYNLCKTSDDNQINSQHNILCKCSDSLDIFLAASASNTSKIKVFATYEVCKKIKKLTFFGLHPRGPGLQIRTWSQGSPYGPLWSQYPHWNQPPKRLSKPNTKKSPWFSLRKLHRSHWHIKKKTMQKFLQISFFSFPEHRRIRNSNFTCWRSFARQVKRGTGASLYVFIETGG